MAIELHEVSLKENIYLLYTHINIIIYICVCLPKFVRSLSERWDCPL